MLKKHELDKNGDLVLTLSFDQKGVPSKSGKSLVHATTSGNTSVSLNGHGAVQIGINVYSAQK